MFDIVDSVMRDRDGYLYKLNSNYKSTQTKFDNAIKEIYGYVLKTKCL